MPAKVLSFEDAAKVLNVELIANGRGTQAVHETVVALRAARRAGTHCVKTKATVQKSGSKPWRQKGTGRARAGYAASPVWRGGGVVFGPHPRDYSKDTPRKVRQLALKKAFGERVKMGDVMVVEAFDLATGKTKDFVAWLKANNFDAKTVLLVDVEHPETFLRATDNVPYVATARAADVNTEQVLRYDKIYTTKAALGVIGERLQPKGK